MVKGLLLLSERPGKPMEVYSMNPPTPEPWGKDVAIAFGALMSAIVPVWMRDRWAARRKKQTDSAAVEIERLKNEPIFAKMFEELADKRLSESTAAISELKAEVKAARDEIRQLSIDLGIQTGLRKEEVSRNNELRDRIILQQTQISDGEREREALRQQISVLQSAQGVRQGERRATAVPQQVEVINSTEHPVPVIDPQK